MALLQKNEIKVKAFGEATKVPQNSVAAMMFYIHCVNIVLPLNQIISNISTYTNYKNYQSLSQSDIAFLIKLLVLLDIRELEGKCFFLMPELCGNFNNQFFEIEQVQDSLLLAGNAALLIQGVNLRVNKIMVYNSTWLNKYYINPLLQIKNAIEQQQKKKYLGRVQLVLKDILTKENEIVIAAVI